MHIKTTNGKTIKANYGDEVLEIGPKAKEFGPEESRFILSGYFARNFSPNVEAVSPKAKEIATEPAETDPES